MKLFLSSLFCFIGLCFCYCCSVTQSCLTFCDPMDCSMPGCSVLHHHPELFRTHVHWVSDAIQPSHPVLPLSSWFQFFPESGSFPVSWLFASGGPSSRDSASVLPMNIQGWLPLGSTNLISLLSNGLSRFFCNTTIQKHQFFGVQPSLLSSSHIHTWLHGKPLLAMSLLFSTLSRLSELFFQGASIFYVMAADTICSDFAAQENKVCYCFHYFPIYLPRTDGIRCHHLRILNVEL